uniref:Uncharacterized protein n=1 Tax=Varroa jacobsoni virus 4 TaxID=2746886 RepID=A0A7D5BF90_9VIRU|nr:hypothetical protein [Varroa jacobsoni virus 4]
MVDMATLGAPQLVARRAVGDVNSPADSANYRGYDSLGRPAVRSGQTVGITFPDAVMASYSNLVYHPIALVCLFFGSLIALYEYGNAYGPLELALTNVNSWDPGSFGFVKTILLNFVRLAVANKMFFSKTLMLFSIYLVKPSNRTLTWLAVMMFYFIVVNIDMIEAFLICQGLYLLVMLRSPVHKLISICFIGLVMIFDSVMCRFAVLSTS